MKLVMKGAFTRAKYFFEGVEKCIHDCVGIKCHKTHVLPRMATKEMFQEIHT
ncbi:unnamed protein product [Brassica napus]|uniref:(rape) hypothetical protein n=1 Tax=Brassica napus TaxID=3708 RepID=A0A816J208_BRANA|nr:unnamed protein product [Brassica napus]